MKGKFIVLILILCFWQMLDFLSLRGSSQVTSPLGLLNALLDSLKDGQIIIDSLSSIERVLIGFGIASLIAIPTALISVNYKIVRNILNPIVEVLRPIPPIAWIPISIIFFGLGDVSSYFIVFLGSFFPIFSNTYLGASSLPLIYKHVSETFEVNVFDYFRRILLKFSLPYIFTGLKIGIGMAWMSVIASELVSGQSGLGYFIQINRLLLNLDNVIIGMLFIGLIGFAFNTIFNSIESFFVPWNKTK